jgi:hypothetical protein
MGINDMAQTAPKYTLRVRVGNEVLIRHMNNVGAGLFTQEEAKIARLDWFDELTVDYPELKFERIRIDIEQVPIAEVPDRYLSVQQRISVAELLLPDDDGEIDDESSLYDAPASTTTTTTKPNKTAATNPQKVPVSVQTARPATAPKAPRPPKSPASDSKKVGATNIFKQEHGDRKRCIARFLSELSMTQAGANTYFYTIKKQVVLE